MPDPRPWARPLTEVLELEPAGPGRYRAALDGFGAITLDCATLAAALSADHRLHAVHAWFRRPVLPKRAWLRPRFPLPPERA